MGRRPPRTTAMPIAAPITASRTADRRVAIAFWRICLPVGAEVTPVGTAGPYTTIQVVFRRDPGRILHAHSHGPFNGSAPCRGRSSRRGDHGGLLRRSDPTALGLHHLHLDTTGRYGGRAHLGDRPGQE